MNLQKILKAKFLKEKKAIKKELSESCDRKPTTLGGGSSSENQVAAFQTSYEEVEADVFDPEVQTVKDKSYCSIKTVSGCALVVSKGNENSYGDISVRSRKMPTTLSDKSSVEKQVEHSNIINDLKGFKKYAQVSLLVQDQ